MPNRPIVLRPASTVPLDTVAGLLSQAFADYLVPAAFSTATLRATVARDDVLLDRSYVATLDDAPVGVALVAVRPARQGTRTRLAGMGVVPQARRSGVARALLERVVAEARERGAPTIALEVFERNTAALRLYKGYGFVATRRLLGFTLPLPPILPPPAMRLPAVVLRPVDAPMLLPLFGACASEEPAEAAPPWQLEAASLAQLGPSAAVYAIAEQGNARPAGYIALSGEGGTLRLTALGIAPSKRRSGLATAALTASRATHPAVAALSVAPLVPERSALVPFLAARGATLAGEAQVEMVARP